MEIKCPRTKKFHFGINIEEYIGDLEKLGIEQQTPIIIKIPCSRCKMIEEFTIYKNRVSVNSVPNIYHK